MAGLGASPHRPWRWPGPLHGNGSVTEGSREVPGSAADRDDCHRMSVQLHGAGSEDEPARGGAHDPARGPRDRALLPRLREVADDGDGVAVDHEPAGVLVVVAADPVEPAVGELPTLTA